mmetsp:Transcript_94625/g.187482  ORF Transcript_94625/g.187482 Transcript_94625/m.187482 type:complete len:935 (-) Transcript_94625:101-2905(-)
MAKSGWMLQRGQTAPLLTSSEAVTGRIQVCVRARPIAQRELGEEICVSMPNKSQIIVRDRQRKGKAFEFDRAFWSCDAQDAKHASQQVLMNELGSVLVEQAQNGYNSCLFAYGQTGSGKTYTILGSEQDPDSRGLLPRVAEELFQVIDEQQARSTEAASVDFYCKVSYLEIYNEQVQDLLVGPDERSSQKLEVRQHPKLGTYVPGLTENAVTKYTEVRKMLEFGAKTRSVASTNMNASSSRSHCIFTFYLEKHRETAGRASDLRAKLNLVDLAGSERQSKSGVEGERQTEGAMINQSLSYLALVINKLADASMSRSKSLEHVPFRNSKLTHLLQESLGGNSQTVMLAAVSPALSNYEETMSTLRFAATCKNVTTVAIKNELSSELIISELQKEIEMLRAAVDGENTGFAMAPSQMLQQLQENEQLRLKLEQSHKAQLAEAKKLENQRTKALEAMGLNIDETSTAFRVDSNYPQLVNISEDPSLSGCLLYYLRPGEDATLGAAKENKIVLKGLGIQPYMCSFRNERNKTVMLTLLGPDGEKLEREGVSQKTARVLVNGSATSGVTKLRHMDRVILGHAYCFRLIIPLISMTPKGGRASIYAACQGGIEEALQEVMHEHTPEFKECRAMMDSIQDRIGVAKVKTFLNDFGKALALVEEGNQITKEVHDMGNKVRFQLEVCNDVKTFTRDEPELLVRMYRDSVEGDAVKESVFELPQFKHRLEHMREVYHFQTNPQAATTKQSDVPDPWAVCSYHEFQRLQKELKDRDDQIAQLLQVAKEDHENYLAGFPTRSASQPSFCSPDSPGRSRTGRSKTPQTPRGAGGGIRAAVANGSWTPRGDSSRANSLTPSISDDTCWGNTGLARQAHHRWDEHRRVATNRLPHRWGDGNQNLLSPRRQDHTYTWLRGVQPRFGVHPATYAQRSRALTPRRAGLNWKP